MDVVTARQNTIDGCNDQVVVFKVIVLFTGLPECGESADLRMLIWFF
jgi:hypothetical protein